MPSLDTEETAGRNLFQAAEYYNSCIFRDLAPALDLGRNPQIHDASPAQLQEALTIPDFIRLGLLCMTLSHRINQLGTRDIPQSKVLAERYYLCRGKALRSLSKQFDAEHNCTSDFVIGGVLTLLLLDIQSGAPPHWLHHLQGVRKLVDLRGGFRTLAATQSLAPLLHCLWFVGIITNTTCPKSHLDTSAISHLEALDFMIEKYGSAMTPSQVWPPQLLAEVIKITHIRLQVTRKRTGNLERISAEAYEIVDRIQGFSPEQLSESKASSREDWTCIGNVYKSAVALYCVLSLQSASVLPETPTLRASCAAHGQHLQHLLSTSLSSPRTRMFMFWPLILLGVEAVHGDARTRDFVSKHLLELSRVVGTSVPLTAQRVLASFWTSGEQSWDACFDRPYPFTTQIAVDVGRVYAPR